MFNSRGVSETPFHVLNSVRCTRCLWCLCTWSDPDGSVEIKRVELKPVVAAQSVFPGSKCGTEPASEYVTGTTFSNALCRLHLSHLPSSIELLDHWPIIVGHTLSKVASRSFVERSLLQPPHRAVGKLGKPKAFQVSTSFVSSVACAYETRY